MKTIQELIDDALIPTERQRSGKWNPSSFGGCFRKQFWSRKNETPSNPPDQRTLRIFEAGRLFEKFVVDLIAKENHIDLQVLVECEDVKGYADLVNGNEVADVKSQHSKSFWWMLKRDCDIRAEKYHNWLQVMYYACELKKQFGRLIFISKDDLCIQEYVQPLNDYWLSELDMELSELRMLWEQDELPPALPRLFKKKDGSFGECAYCQFLDKCQLLESEKENENANCK